jgi:hypothetical protein
MKLATFFNSHLFLLFFACFSFSLTLAQDPPTSGGNGQGSGSNTGGGRTNNPPNFGLNDNDTWNMQVPNNPPGSQVTPSMVFDKGLVFQHDPNSGEEDIRIMLKFTDVLGNPLNVLNSRFPTHQLTLDYDLSSLPADALYLNDGKTGELLLSVDVDLETPANYLTDSSRRYLRVHYEVYGKTSNTSKYSLLLGKTTSDYLTFNLVPDSSSKSRQGMPASALPISLQAAPNPCSQQLRLEVSGASLPQVRPQLLDLQGRAQPYQLLSREVKHDMTSFHLDLSQLSPGYYLIRIPGTPNAQPLRVLKAE